MSYKCNEDALSLPIVGCDDCSAFEARIKELEDLMEGVLLAQEEMQNAIEDLQDAMDGKQDKLTAGDGIQIENNVISTIPPTKITFTLEPTLVCDAVVCESTVCTTITVDQSAETIVNDMKNNNGQNMVLVVGNKTYLPSSFVVENEIMNLYRVYFDALDLEEVVGQYTIIGDNESLEYVYEEYSGGGGCDCPEEILVVETERQDDSQYYRLVMKNTFAELKNAFDNNMPIFAKINQTYEEQQEINSIINGLLQVHNVFEDNEGKHVLIYQRIGTAIIDFIAQNNNDNPVLAESKPTD